MYNCGKELSNYNNKRCHKCELKRRYKEGIMNMKGKNNPMFGKKGKNHPKFGVKHSEETRKKQSKAMKQRYIENPSFNRGENHPLYGKKGKLHPKFGKKHSSETRRKQSLGVKNSYQDNPQLIELRKKHIIEILSKCSQKPNRKENQLSDLLNKLFPNEYKYVGDFSFWIESYNPDFININGKKKIIELFGDYWHNLPEYKKRDKERLKTYKKYGYDVLIIWEHELNNIEKLKQKILKFHRLTS